jgi:hypothetical protein
VTADRALAMQIAVAMVINWDNHHGVRAPTLAERVSDAIEQAVLDERKACAEIADRNATCRWAARMVAREIRARATR